MNSESQSARMSSKTRAATLGFALAGAMLVSLVLPALAAGAKPRPRDLQQQGSVEAEISAPVTPYVFDGDLRDLPRPVQWQPGDPVKEIPRRAYFPPGQGPEQYDDEGEPAVDSLLQVQAETPPNTSLVFTTTSRSFPGQGYTGVNPPDTVGDVGPNHYIQSINAGGGAVVRIWDKAEPTPNELTSFTMDNLGTGSCAGGLGDPIVLYDRLADRWMISEFSSSGNRLCLYISQTPDPVSGGWFNYDFQAPSFPDYPKYGVWPTDANGGQGSYIATTNESGSGVYALDRGKMLAGEPATFQRFSIGDLPGFPFNAVTPADMDGPDGPAAGTPAIIMRHRDTEVHNGPSAPGDLLEMWHFDVDWVDTGNTTFTQIASIDIEEIDSTLCGLSAFACFQQPGTGTTLDPLREVIMNRLQYYNYGDYETLAGNLVTDVDGNNTGGLRWFELRRSGGGAWALHQEGTYSPDGDSRWMAASALDQSGNFAIAYNVSSTSTFPSLRYSGRLVDDALGALTQAESVIHDGTASNSSNRYGDYSAMNLDPEDDCTFWFTGMDNTANTWRTQVASFAFDACGCELPPSALTVTAQVTGDNEIEIGWNDADLPTVIEYRIQRSRTPGGPYEVVGTVADTSPGIVGGPDYFFTDTTVSGGITYYYIVRASDGESCKSPASNEASETATGDCLLDPLFGGLVSISAPPFVTCTLELSWNPATAECDGPITYNVYRSELPGFTPGAGNLLATGVNSTVFTDVNQLVNGTLYYYVVRAVDNSNGSEDDNTRIVSRFPFGNGVACITGSGCQDNPFVNVLPDGPATVCEDSVVLSADLSGGNGPFLFQWTRDGVDIPGAIAPDFVPDDLGTHTFNVKVRAQSCPDNVFDGIPSELTFVNTPFFDGVKSVVNPQTPTCSLEVNWDPASTVCDGPLRYFVYRDTVSPVALTEDNLVGAGVFGTSFSDPGPLDNRVEYFYKVRSQDVSTGMSDSNNAQDSIFPDGPGSGPQAQLDESFEDAGLFAGWSVTTGPGVHTCGEWALSTSSAQRPSGGSGSFAVANNECGGLLGRTSTTMTSPPINVDLTNIVNVMLEYDLWFNYDPGDGNETGRIEVWDGSAWQLIWQSSAADVNGHQSFDVTAFAAGNPNFQVRFDYQNATKDKWMSVDDVQVIALIDISCATGPLGPGSAPDGSLGTGPLRGERVDLAGDVIGVTWDATTCGATGYNLIYGDLADVSALSLSGSQCSIGTSGSFSWNGVPAGSLFYLVVGEDGGGTESSWGRDSLGGERNGFVASGECGSSVKDTSGTCP